MQICLVLTTSMAIYYLAQLLKQDINSSFVPSTLWSGGTKFNRPLDDFEIFFFLCGKVGWKLMFSWFHYLDIPFSMQFPASSPLPIYSFLVSIFSLLYVES